MRDFSDALMKELRGYYPEQNDVAALSFGHPADEFVSRVLVSARPILAKLYWIEFETTNQTLRATQAELLGQLKRLCKLSKKLRKLPPEYSLLLSPKAVPLDWADTIDSMLLHFKAADKLINPSVAEDMGPPIKTKQRGVKKYAVLVEMAVDVLRILKKYGIAAKATGGGEFDYKSKAVQILEAIGGDVNDRPPSAATWRHIIVRAKSQAPDLE